METQTPDPNDVRIGPALYESGWRQGAVISSRRLLEEKAPGALLLSVVPIGEDTTLVIVSQTCDIVATLAREPAIEALICRLEVAGDVTNVVNSSRYFPIDPVKKLIAYASRRVIIPKEAVRGLSPDPFIWAPDRFPLFQRWLADRWRRADFPDKVIQHLGGPLRETLRKARKKEPETWEAINSQVSQFRIACGPEVPGIPIEVDIIALVKPSATSSQLTEIRRLVGIVIDKANSANGQPLRIGPLKFTTPAHISLADAWEFRPLDFDYLSTDGTLEVAVADGLD